MRHKNLDLIIAIGIASINVIWALLPERLPLIGVILGLPLVFVLPGYALTEALSYKQSLDGSHRLVFSLGLSLAIAILNGFFLNLFPIGLQEKSWALSLGLLTAVFSLQAAYLRRVVSRNGTHLPRFRLAIYAWILFGLAVIVAIQAILYSIVGAEQQPYPGFTQLWMLPPAQDGKSCTVQLGIHNFETVSVTYDLTLTMNQTKVATWHSIVLAPQEKWSRLIPIASKTEARAYVEARLYRLDKPKSVYQQVNLTLRAGMEDPCLRSSSDLRPSQPSGST